MMSHKSYWLMLLVLLSVNQYLSDINQTQAVLHSNSSPPALPLQKGLLHEKKNEFHEARTCYQNALAINPYHLKSLRHLVSTWLLFWLLSIRNSSPTSSSLSFHLSSIPSILASLHVQPLCMPPTVPWPYLAACNLFISLLSKLSSYVFSLLPLVGPYCLHNNP